MWRATRSGFLLSASVLFGCDRHKTQDASSDLSTVFHQIPAHHRSILVVPYQHGVSDVSINADAPLRAASIIKLLIAVAFIHNNADFASRTYFVPPQAAVAESSYLRSGSRVLGASLLQLMMSYSDNVAANVAILLEGARAINSFGNRIGLQSTHLHGLFQNEPDRLAEWASTSAKDICTMLRYILDRSRTASPEQQGMLMLLRFLVQQRDRRLVEAGLPMAIVVANKTGEVTGTLNDALILDPFGDAPVLVAVMATGVQDYYGAITRFNQIGFAIFARLYDNLMKRSSFPTASNVCS